MPKYKKKDADKLTILLISLIVEYFRQGKVIDESILEFLQWIHKEVYG